MITHVEKLVMLRDTGLLRYMESDDLYLLVEIAREIVCNEGQTLFREGEPASMLFAVVSGLVQLTVGEEGRPLAQVPAGRFVGEAALFAAEPHRFTATAVQGYVAALGFEESELAELIVSRPRLGLFFLREMARHWLDGHAEGPQAPTAPRAPEPAVEPQTQKSQTRIRTASPPR